MKTAGYNVGISLSYEPFDLPDESAGTTTITSLFGGWSLSGLRAGGELDLRTITHAANARIISVYMTAALAEKLGAICRIDQFDDAETSNLFVIIGGQWFPERGLRITPNIQYTRPDSNDEGSTSLFVNFEFKI